MRLDIKPTVMPQVEACYPYLADAEDAISRAIGSWNTTQLEDALRSLEFFIGMARDSLKQKRTDEAITYRN